MIPQLETQTETQEVQYDVQPSKTYRFDITNKKILGMTDGWEAYKISAEKILLTKRYAHIIYDGNYGFEKDKYVGKEFDFVQASIQRDIYDALSQDDRFYNIRDFIIQKTSLDSCIINFSIISTEGIVPMTLEV